MLGGGTTTIAAAASAGEERGDAALPETFDARAAETMMAALITGGLPDEKAANAQDAATATTAATSWAGILSASGGILEAAILTILEAPIAMSARWRPDTERMWAVPDRLNASRCSFGMRSVLPVVTASAIGATSGGRVAACLEARRVRMRASRPPLRAAITPPGSMARTVVRSSGRRP